MGSDVPTIRDVAARAGVSLGTVSNYINSTRTISPATTARIEQAIEATKFVPNRAVRTLRGNLTQAIGFLVPETGNPFLTEIARGIETEAREQDHVLVICDTNGDVDLEKRYVRNLAEMRVAGAIAVVTRSDQASLEDLTSINASLVVLGDELPSIDASSVGFNHYAGGYLAMKHLLDLGHRFVAFAGGPSAESVLDQRYQATVDALAEAGLDESHVTRIDAAGRSLAQRTELFLGIMNMHPRPTAVLCGNDMIALAIEHAMHRAGLSAPDDLALVGYDDIPDAELAVTPLTTVRQPALEIGAEAARILFAQSARTPRHLEHLVFEPQLVVRESTVGRAPAPK